jgi:hypothetical protein
MDRIGYESGNASLISLKETAEAYKARMQMKLGQLETTAAKYKSRVEVLLNKFELKDDTQ